MTKLTHYKKQSIYSDPRALFVMFRDLPNDIDKLRNCVQGLFIHHYQAKQYYPDMHADRCGEIELRSSYNILRRITELSTKSLLQIRSDKERCIASCRDYSLLLCSILRYKGIPARLRYGFTNYLYKNYYHDQAMIEYWNKDQAKWMLVDARTSPQLILDKKLNIDFDLCDVPRDRFIVAGKAWLLCRHKAYNPKRFGAGLLNQFNGFQYIFERIVHDLASLNYHEMLLWDYWGIMLQDGKIDLNDSTINLIAEKTAVSDITAATAIELYTHHRSWQVHGIIQSYSPDSPAYQIDAESLRSWK